MRFWSNHCPTFCDLISVFFVCLSIGRYPFLSACSDCLFVWLVWSDFAQIIQNLINVPSASTHIRTHVRERTHECCILILKMFNFRDCSQFITDDTDNEAPKYGSAQQLTRWDNMSYRWGVPVILPRTSQVKRNREVLFQIKRFDKPTNRCNSLCLVASKLLPLPEITRSHSHEGFDQTKNLLQYCVASYCST